MNRVLSITSKATDQIKKIMSQAPNGMDSVVIGVDKSCCSGYAYKLDFGNSSDFKDFEIGKKHDLEFVNILDKAANLNKNTPKGYQGLNRFVARKKLISELKKNNKILKIVNNKMFLPIGDRSDEIIEPLLTFQWFLDTKKISIKVKKAIKEKKIVFHPNSWINTFKYWIENIEPWCISRQIWWGHRIPIWYSKNGLKIAAKSEEEAIDILKLKDETDKILYQDEDVLDTWFSSALWPFSTLGWHKNNKLLKNFYPSNVLVTGFDIIFFWVARMVMMGLEFMNEVPFKNIYYFKYQNLKIVKT